MLKLPSLPQGIEGILQLLPARQRFGFLPAILEESRAKSLRCLLGIGGGGTSSRQNSSSTIFRGRRH